MASSDTIARIEGSVQDGGWKASGAVLGDADRLSFYQEIEIWFDLYTSAGWEALPRPAFRGHLLPDPWQKTFQSSEAPWSAFTSQEIMKRGEVQGIFYKHVASAPGNRHQIISMTYSEIVYEIMGHFNLMHRSEPVNYDSSLWSGAFTTQTFPEGFLFLDFNMTGSSAVSEYDLKQGNFWGRLQEIANIDFYLIYVDKYNKLHYIPHPMFGASLPTAVMTLTNAHLLEPLTIERRNTEQVGQVRLQGTTPQGLQISGKYPTDATAGPPIQKSGYMATSSTLMNTIATRMYKFENRDYTVTAKLNGAVGLMFDLLDRIAITYTSSADGVTWSSKMFWIHKIAVELKDNFNAVTTLTLEAENA
jgi:hypothetical protein